MYTNSKGQIIQLGNELGKGGAANVYFHATDKSKAVKIFKPDFLAKEFTIGKRLEQLNKLSNIAQLKIKFGQNQKSIGAWPKDIVKDKNGRIVGYIMDTASNAIDLSHVVMARNTSAFYKLKNKPQYNLWFSHFLYHPNGIKNRFVLSYYIALFFDKIYNLKTDDQNA